MFRTRLGRRTTCHSDITMWQTQGLRRSRRKIWDYESKLEARIHVFIFFCHRSNKEEFATEYIVSFNNDAHDNVVWNYMTGWFAYTSQNMIIVETLTKGRTQKIINLPDQVSCLNLSKDFKFMVAGSASFNEREISTVYVIDCKSFEIIKTLSFHTRGVQCISFSSNRKYIVSVGNCKECTLAIWEWPSGKLVTSSYTLDRINDLKISEIVNSPDNALEFCTVGRDTI